MAMPRLLLAFVLCLAPAGAGAQFFRAGCEADRCWLLDPQGRPFFSTGVNVVSTGQEPETYDPEHPRYSPLRSATFEAWYARTTARLSAWGFNTLGAWSEPQVAERRDRATTLELGLGQWIGAPWVDPRSEKALSVLRQRVDRLVRPHRGDPLLVGYFLDNELRWFPGALFRYWAREPGSERLKRRLVDLLREEYGGDLAALRGDFQVRPEPADFQALEDPVELEVRPGREPRVVARFAELLAEEYYGTVAGLVRAADPDHLLLGDRYASFYSEPVARAAARHLDVVSVNHAAPDATGWISPAFFDSLHRLTGKPILVTEFYAAAEENRSGNRNRSGHFPVFRTQAQRARAVAQMTEALARLPYVVGYHWFQWPDEPPRGRDDDGEDYDMGLVDIHDRPYEEVTAAFASANAAAVARHREGRRPQGLVAQAGAWQVPRLERVQIDGRLDEWPLPSHLLPEVAPGEGHQPFGDLFLAWDRDGLLIALAYQDAGLAERRLDVPGSRTRLHLALGNREVSVTGLDEREQAAPAPLRSAGGVAGAQRLRSLLTTAELRVPAAELGRRRLSRGDRLRFSLRLSLPGGSRELRFAPRREVRLR